jgi:hypothetical protein
MRVGDDLAIIPDIASIQVATKPKGVFGHAYTVEAQTVSGRRVKPVLIPFTNIGRWYREDQPRPGRDQAAYSYAIWLLSLNAPEFQERARQLSRQQSQLNGVIDFVTIGDPASEGARRVQGGLTASFNGRIYRHGEDFSYELKIRADRTNRLVVTYWGGDKDREFDVLANDHVLRTQKLDSNRPGTFYDETYEIPPDLVRGRTDDFGRPVEVVTVRFKTRNQDVAGGIYALRIE